MLVTLLAQFGLGMYVNLFIHIPPRHPGAGESNYLTATFRGIAWLETSKDAPVVVATHAGVGLTLVIGSVWLVTGVIRTHGRPTVLWSAIAGGLCILAAAINGGSFLDYNDDVNSYLMAMFFAAAVVCYGVILALPTGELGDAEPRERAVRPGHRGPQEVHQNMETYQCSGLRSPQNRSAE